jgi:polysaccharide export outer membrane protein
MMDPFLGTARAIAVGLVWSITLAAWPLDYAIAAPVKVTAVTLLEAGREPQVSIATSGPARYEQRSVRADWVVVDIIGAELGVPAGTVRSSSGAVSRVRAGQFAPDVVRVVVELFQPMHVHLGAGPDGTGIIVRIPAVVKGGSATATAAGSSSGGRGGMAKVTGITLWGTPTRPWVSITASGPVRYQLRGVEPDRVVVDVSKAQLALTSGRLPAGRGLVKQIRAGQLTSDVVRVVVELARPIRVHIATSPDRAAIIVSLAGQARTPGSPTQPETDGTAPPAFSQPPAASTSLMTSASPAVTAPTSANPPHPTGGGPASPAAQVTPGAPFALAAATPGQPSPGPYLLGPQDVLEITVWGYPDMTRVVTVRPDGQVAVPLAGTVPAAGRSVERLTQDLTRAYAKYIINPQVTVIVKEFGKIRTSVLGQVTKPGTYELPPGTRILDALSAANGVTDNAALTTVEIVHASGVTQPINLEALLLNQDMRQNLVLQPGDTLIIPEDTTNKFYVLGDVNHPGIYPLKGDVTVLQALAAAGGPVLHGTSTSTTAHIVRRVDPRQGPLTASIRRGDVQQIANGNGLLITMDLRKMYKGDLSQNETLRPGDVMVVPAPGAANIPSILNIISTILLGIHL